MNPENHLNELIKNAANEEPILSLSDISKNLGNKPKSNLKTFSNNHILLIFITMSTLLILVVWMNIFFQNDIKSSMASTQTKPTTKSNQLLPSENKPKDVKPVQRPKSKTPINQTKNNRVIQEQGDQILFPELDKTKQESLNDSFKTTFAKRIINLKNIHVIELNNDELKSLGITIENNEIKVPIATTEKGNVIYTRYSKYGSTTTFNLKENDLPVFGPKFKVSLGNKLTMQVSDSLNEVLKNNPSQFSLPTSNLPRKNADSIYKTIPIPTLVTDDLGQKWLSYSMDDGLTEVDMKYMKEHNLNPNTYPKAIEARKNAEKKLIEKLPGFIPILIKSGDVKSANDKTGFRSNIIVWYEPNDRIFNVLPKRISADLIKEYQDVFILHKPTKQCVYFEACQQKSEAFEYYNVFPNPTESNLNLEFELKNSQKLSISMYNINGQLLTTFNNQTEFSKGLNSIQLNTSDLKEGIYLLVIQTEKEEVISKRIIKK
jgi:cytoskeletal protein RodZ